MTFQPIVPATGYVGWRFLQRTIEVQQETFNKSLPVQRDTDYFRENIGSIKTAEDLVSDRRLLRVALGAFGLDDDINNKFFITKVLEDGVTGNDALANRLSDKSYFAFSLEFGLNSQSSPRTGLSGFADRIIGRFEQKQFALAVGEQDEDMRLALNVSSSLSEIVKNNESGNARWFSVMGNAPLRKVFETALGLPSSIAGIDLDQQLQTFKERSNAVFGTRDLGNFLAEDRQEDLIRLFLIRSQALQTNGLSSGNVALTLLQAVPNLNS